MAITPQQLSELGYTIIKQKLADGTIDYALSGGGVAPGSRNISHKLSPSVGAQLESMGFPVSSSGGSSTSGGWDVNSMANFENYLGNELNQIESKKQQDISSQAQAQVNALVEQYRKSGGSYEFDPELLKKAGMNADWVINNGVFTTKKQVEEANKLKNDPNMVNIGTAERPMYVPRNSTVGQQFINTGSPLFPNQNAGGVSAAGVGQTAQTYYNKQTGATIDLKNYPNMTDADLRAQGWIPTTETPPQATGSPTTQPTIQTGTTGQTTEQWIQRPGGQAIPISQSGFKNLQDAANAGYSPVAPPQGQTGQTGQTGATDTMKQLIEKYIASDPFLSEQLANPEIRKLFDSLPPELQGSYLSLIGVLGKRIETGQIINPDIKITPEKAKEFLNQATSELDPYYKEQIGNIKQDLETSFARLQEDFDKGIRRAEEPFKMSMEAQAQGEAMAGTAYSSGRVKREAQAIQEQQDILNDYFTQAQRSVEDAGRAAERQIGSENIRSLNIPSLSGYNVGAGGFTPTNGRVLFTPGGNLMGSIPKQRTVDINQRASQLEEAYRNQRVLDLSKL